jgi:hypothetical protein
MASMVSSLGNGVAVGVEVGWGVSVAVGNGVSVAKIVWAGNGSAVTVGAAAVAMAVAGLCVELQPTVIKAVVNPSRSARVKRPMCFTHLTVQLQA